MSQSVLKRSTVKRTSRHFMTETLFQKGASFLLTIEVFLLTVFAGGRTVSKKTNLFPDGGGTVSRKDQT